MEFEVLCIPMRLCITHNIKIWQQKNTELNYNIDGSKVARKNGGDKQKKKTQ